MKRAVGPWMVLSNSTGTEWNVARKHDTGNMNTTTLEWLRDKRGRRAIFRTEAEARAAALGAALVVGVDPATDPPTVYVHPAGVTVHFTSGAKDFLGPENADRRFWPIPAGVTAADPPICKFCGKPEVEQPHSKANGWKPPLMCCAFGRPEAADGVKEVPRG